MYTARPPTYLHYNWQLLLDQVTGHYPNVLIQQPSWNKPYALQDFILNFSCSGTSVKLLHNCRTTGQALVEIKTKIFYGKKTYISWDLLYPMLQKAWIQNSAISDLLRSCISQWLRSLFQLEVITVCTGFSLKIWPIQAFQAITWKIKLFGRKVKKNGATRVYTWFYRVFFYRSDLFKLF